MLYSIKKKGLENLEELASLKRQVRAVRLQDNLGKEIFHEEFKKVFEPITKSPENRSQDITKSITGTSIKINQALEILNNKLLEIMNDRGILASYLMSRLSKITNPENTTQFKLIKNFNPNRVNDLPIHNTTPVTLHDNLLTFRDTNKQFELKGHVLKMITNKNYNFGPASLTETKILYDFAKKCISISI